MGSDLIKALLSHKQVTWWRFQEWAVLCQPEHTSSSPWTGGTGLLYKVLQVHSQEWRWPVEDAAELHPGRSVAPGHKRELSLKPWETHLIQRQRLFHHKHTPTSISVSLDGPLSRDPAGRFEPCLVSTVVYSYTQQNSHLSRNTSAIFPADGTNHRFKNSARTVSPLWNCDMNSRV